MRASGREPNAENLSPPQGGVLAGGEGPGAFGKYQLFATLGRGGMAEVFLAVSRGPMGFNKLVVVKRLRNTLAEEPSFLNMFLDEARLAARLNHPNVVHTYEVGEFNNHYFIAMEYLEGQSLFSMMRSLMNSSETLPVAMNARIVADALAGLHYAHELKDYDGTPVNIIHRDVSPHNVFVTYEGAVKLVDFGIAKAALSRTQTEVGVLKGKVAYMAPEQAVGSPIDRRADVFAMGIVLWELLGRRRLMASESAAVTLHRLLNQPIPKLSEVVPDIDPRLDAIAAKALEKEPAKRFQTAQEMRDALEGYIAQSGAIVRQEEIGARMNRLFEKTRADVKRQIQEHMAMVDRAANSGELATLNSSALRGRLTSSGSLPTIATQSGTGGSGVVMLPPGGAIQVAAQAQAVVAPRKSGGLPIVLALLGVLAMAAIAFIAWQRTTPKVVAAEPAPSASVAPPSVSAATPTTPPTPDSATATAAAILPSATATATATTTTAAPPARTGWMAHTPAPTHAPAPANTPQPTAEPEAAAAATGPGFLTLDTVPWTKVSEGGRSLGTTPIIGVPLSAGAHTLSLENPGAGIHTSISLVIKSGDHVSRRMMLKQPQ